MRLDIVLARVDEETLKELLGSHTVRLVTLLDPRLATQPNLCELLVQLRTPEGLLLDQRVRTELFSFLKPEEASALADVLAIPSGASRDIYSRLASIRIRAGSEIEAALFNFFELRVPASQERSESEDIVQSHGQYSLFEYQRRAARAVGAQLRTEPRRVLLHMPTGAGKTRTAMNVIADHLRLHEPALVVWLAYSEELCEQAATEFKEAWHSLGDRTVSVYRFWGDHQLDLDDVQDGIVVASLSKMYNVLKQSLPSIGLLGSKCSLIVIDEAHQSIADTYRLTLSALFVSNPHTALLGLTATPGRTYSDITADEELSEFFARRKVTIHIPGYASSVDYLIAEGYLARPTFRSLFYNSGMQLSATDLARISTELELPTSIVERLAQDEQRNLRIVVEIEKLARSHRRILVFAISVKHAELLTSVLQLRGLSANVVTGATAPILRAHIIRDYRTDSDGVKILCNFGVLTAGFDAPRTSAAVIARPTKSLVLYSQMVGRAIRGVRAQGNATAEIVTVVDSELPGFGAVAEAFENWEDVWIPEEKANA